MSATGQHIPDDLLYSTDHQWVRVERTADRVVVRTGITDFAQDTIGDVQFVALPAVGEAVAIAQPCGEAEASKAVTDLYSPVTGIVVSVNTALVQSPHLVNHDPYGEGWLYEVVANEEPQDLLIAQQYRALIA